MRWEGNDLTIDIQERCAPVPFPLRGRVTFSPGTFYEAPVRLAETGNHFWQAAAPHGRVTAEFSAPGLSWSGPAYHDMNWGDEQLENAFTRWTWLRAKTEQGTQVVYDVERRDGSPLAFGRLFREGAVTEVPVPPGHELKRGMWGMTRSVRSETPPRLIGRLEDAPFYTRSHVGLTLGGQACEGFHESLSLDRFMHPAVQLMLPFRMPRFG